MLHLPSLTRRLNSGALAVVLFACLAACGSTPTPTPTARPGLNLLVTASTAALARDAAAVYARVQGIDFQLELKSNAALVEAASSSTDRLGFTVHLPATAGLWSTPVAWDALVVVVHPSNPLTTLTADEVRELFVGRLGTWEAVSDAGLSGEIHPIVREDGSDARAAFEALGLNGLAPSLNALVAPTPNAMLEAVAADPAAIGYALFSQLSSDVRPVPLDGVLASSQTIESGEYAWRLPVLAVAKSEPAGTAREFLFWFQSPEGQALVARTHGRIVR